MAGDDSASDHSADDHDLCVGLISQTKSVLLISLLECSTDSFKIA